MERVLAEPEAHAGALERIVAREIDGLDGLPVKVERGLSDAEAKVLYEKSPALAERVGVKFNSKTNTYDSIGYEHALQKHRKEFGDSVNIFDNWIHISSSTGGLELKSGRDAKKVLKYVYDPVNENLVVLVTDEGRFLTMYHPTPRDFLSELEALVNKEKLFAYKESDDMRYVVLKEFPDDQKLFVKITRDKDHVVIDILKEELDTSPFGKPKSHNNLMTFDGSREKKKFGEMSLLLPTTLCK